MQLQKLFPTAILLAAAVMVPGALRAQIEEGRVPLRTAVTELNTHRVEFADDWNRKDHAAVTALYEADAVALLSDGSMVMGRTAIGQKNSAEAAKWPHLVLKSDSLRVYGNTAVDIGTATYRPASGPTVVERYLVVLRRGMKDWKIVRIALVQSK